MTQKKLTDLQLVLLTSAAQRDGSLLPPPETVGAPLARVRKAVATLIGLGLAEEQQVEDRAASWGEEGETLFGAIITAAGRERVGVPAPIKATEPAVASTKSAQVIQLLKRQEGASLTELVTVTGWLPHTTRAALTGLRKKGHAITTEGERGSTRYRIHAA